MNRQFRQYVAPLLIGAGMFTTSLSGEVLITEIMYNAAGSDTGFEWVEIYNSGTEAVDVTGWKLSDEDSNAINWDLIEGSLQPGQAGIITQSSEAAFKAAWPTAADAKIFTSSDWGSIANTVEEAGNEVISILDDQGEVVDVADYLTVAPWPEGVNGSSIYLLPDFINSADNDDGASWAASTVGVDGGINPVSGASYNVDNIGSPGIVNDPAAASRYVVITEIMYNAAGSDTNFEWVEIYNAGNFTIDVTGWKLSDEDSNALNWELMEGSLEPGQAGIITVTSEANFKASWPTATDAKIFTTAGWGSIANTVEEAGNEVISILDAEGEVVDVADYLTVAPWPEGVNGSSIMLKPGYVNQADNDDGMNWMASEAGIYGAINALADGGYSTDNIGSPGSVLAVIDPLTDLPWKVPGLEPGTFAFSPWFGTFMPGDANWIRHFELGWIMVGYVERIDNMWMYSLVRDNWIWGNSDYWPIVYDYSTGGWILILSLPELDTWIYDYTTSTWSVAP